MVGSDLVPHQLKATLLRGGRNDFEHIIPLHRIKNTLDRMIAIGALVRYKESNIDFTRRKYQHDFIPLNIHIL
jgi:hypothetical protein